MIDFATILGTKVDDVEPPKTAPAGTYQFEGLKATSRKATKEGQFSKFILSAKAVAVMDESVDAELLEEFGDVEKIRLSKEIVIWGDEKDDINKALDQLIKFLTDHCGIEADENATVSDLLDSFAGATFIGEVDHRPDQDDPDVVYPFISKTMADG